MTEGPEVRARDVVKQAEDVGSRERHITAGGNQLAFKVSAIIAQFTKSCGVADNSARTFFS